MGDKSKIEWTEATWTPIRARNLGDNTPGIKEAPILVLPAEPIAALDENWRLLPPEILAYARENAPVDFSVLSLLSAWLRFRARGGSEREGVELLKAFIRDMTAQIAAFDYGPDHPQAKR